MSAAENIIPVQSAYDLAANYGILVFPCKPDKSPATKRGFKDATTNLEQIDGWWTARPDALIGVPTGAASKLLVVDIDPDGADWYHEHAERLACARIHKTRRGHHLVYRMPGCEVRNSASVIAPGVDVRGEGGYIIWWPAHGLEAIGDLADVTEPPEWLVQVLTSPSPPATEVPSEITQKIPAKRRNEYLSREAFRLRKQGATVEQITEALLTLNRVRIERPLEDDEVRKIAAGKNIVQPEPPSVTTDDFWAYMPAHQYIFAPSRELWPASSVNARIEPIVIGLKPIKASEWLDRHRSVEQTTWAPGEPMVIRDRLVADGGWIERAGCACFNLYRPPRPGQGDPQQAGRWIDHLGRVYPDAVEHVLDWFAHRVQKPAEKINHALVFGGAPGIGKDTLIEPVKHAVGPWNVAEVSPAHLLGRFNSFIKSVILRISEARDLGDMDRYAFYEHMKVYTAAPPDVLRCDEKHLREHAVMNVTGVIITTNHKSNGIYLPADDRRHFVVWSDLSKEDFATDYWRDLYRWYAAGGCDHVAAYLADRDISQFDAKAPPPKTPAFWDIVDANRAPEDAELADVLDLLHYPDALTLPRLAFHSNESFREWLTDRRNRRQIPHRLESAGYVPVRNEAANDGMWKCGDRRQAVYARRGLAVRERIEAAAKLAREA